MKQALKAVINGQDESCERVREGLRRIGGGRTRMPLNRLVARAERRLAARNPASLKTRLHD
jgi:hypothetical protein